MIFLSPIGSLWSKVRRVPLEGSDAEFLIDGEGEDAEHQLAFHLDRSAHAHEPAAEFVLESSVDAFDHGAEVIEHVIRVGMWMNFMRATSSAHSVFASCCARKLRSINKTWPSATLGAAVAAAS